MLNDARCWCEIDVLVVADEPELLAMYIPSGAPIRYPLGDLHPWWPKPAWEGYGRWEWKDRELLEQRVREGRFTEEQARRIRAEAELVAQELDAGERWWGRDWASWDWASWSPG